MQGQASRSIKRSKCFNYEAMNAVATAAGVVLSVSGKELKRVI